MGMQMHVCDGSITFMVAGGRHRRHGRGASGRVVGGMWVLKPTPSGEGETGG